MPGVFYRPLSRKQFFRTSMGACGALLFSHAWLPGSEIETGTEKDPSATDLRLALLSDTHIAADPADSYRDFRPSENLERVVEQVRSAAPDAALINGDAARLEGQAGDYEQLKTLLEPLASQLPIGIGLGNHDDRSEFRRVFSQEVEQFARQPVADKQVVVLEHPQVRVIQLDSLLYVNQVAGLLGKQQREWLARFLTDRDNRPTVLVVHHTLGDNDVDLLDTERLFRLVEPHRNLHAIFFGHSHRYEFRREGRLQLVNLPACGYNFTDDQPVGWVMSRFFSTGCELTLHALGGNRAEDGRTVTLPWET